MDVQDVSVEWNSCLNRIQRSVPGFKVIQDTNFLVDAFRYSDSNYCRIYFLTHFHSDHYDGLRSSFNHGLILCTFTTARLCQNILGIHQKYLRPIPFNQPVLLSDIQGISKTFHPVDDWTVTFIDANHCPGASQIIFQSVIHSKTHLHTGDFRYDKEVMLSIPFLRSIAEEKSLNSLYLDTTYIKASKGNVFPSYEESLQQIIEIIESALKKEPKTLVLLQTYSLGKERILVAIAERFKFRIYAPKTRWNMIQNLDSSELIGSTLNVSELRDVVSCEQEIQCAESDFEKADLHYPVHVVRWDTLGALWPYFRPDFGTCKEYLKTVNNRLSSTKSEDVRFKKVLGIIPSGWAMNTKTKIWNSVENEIEIHLVPYSEHSDSQGLREFVSWLKPDRIIPTVGCKDGSDPLQKDTRSQLQCFRGLTKQQQQKPLYRTKIAEKSGESVVPSIVIQQNREIPRDHPIEDDQVQSDLDIQIISHTRRASMNHRNVQSTTNSSSRKRTRETPGFKQTTLAGFFGPKKSPFESALKPIVKCAQNEGCFVTAAEVDAGPEVHRDTGCDVKNLGEDESVKRFKRDELGETVSGSQRSGNVELKSKKCAPDVYLKSIDEYDPVLDAVWDESYCEGVPFLHLARALECIEKERSRLKTLDALTNMFRSVLTLSPEDTTSCAYLVAGKTAPSYIAEIGELGVGSSAVTTVLMEVAGLQRKELRLMYRKYGDLGDVAMKCKARQRLLVQPKPLSVRAVMKTLVQIRDCRGEKSQSTKRNLMVHLMRRCLTGEPEIKFIVRTLINNLRIGASIHSIVQALGRAAMLVRVANSQEISQVNAQSKQALASAMDEASRCYERCPNLDILVEELVRISRLPFDSNVFHLGLEERIQLSTGIPCMPMLAKPSTTILEAVNKVLAQDKSICLQASGSDSNLLHSSEGEQLQGFACEYKYDGQRSQIHLMSESTTVKCFSRHLEDNTERFQSVCAVVKSAAHNNVESAILECEIVAVAFDKESNGYVLRPFQELSTQPKLGQEGRNQLCAFAFDLLCINGLSLHTKSYLERRKLLCSTFKEIPGSFEFANLKVMLVNNGENGSTAENSLKSALVIDEVAEIEDENESERDDCLESYVSTWLRESCDARCEGLMLKSLNSTYEAGKRGDVWRKVKKDYLEGIADSLDLIPIGGWYGNGRKNKWFSPILMACYDPEREVYQSVCRVMSGFSDAFYEHNTKYYAHLCGVDLDQRDFLVKSAVDNNESLASNEEHDTELAQIRQSIGAFDSQRKPMYYETDERCSVWFPPVNVWEIRGADITLSLKHKAAIGCVQKERGLSLRFPRFIKSRTSEGNPSEVLSTMSSTPQDVYNLYSKQAHSKDKSNR